MKKMNINNKLFIYIPAIILISLVLLTLAYQYQPDITIDVGHGQDRIFFDRVDLRQAHLPNGSMRRIRAISNFTLPHLGYGLHYNIAVTARTGEDYPEPAILDIYINKKKMAAMELETELNRSSFTFTEGKIEGDYLLFYFINESEKTPVKKPIYIDRIEIKPVKDSAVILPAFLLFLKFIFILTAFAIMFSFCGKWWGLIASSIISVVLLLCFTFWRIYITPFMTTLLEISLVLLVLAALSKFLLPRLLLKLRLNPLKIHYQIFLLIFILGLFFRLTLWLYPSTISADIDFHAHRFQGVYSNGKILQESMTPEGTFKFPYPTLLYLLLTPVKYITGMEYVTLLKYSISIFDALIPLLIFFFLLKFTQRSSAAVTGAGLYSLIPIVTDKFIWGICTEIFAVFLAWLLITVLAFNYKNLMRFKKVIPLTLLLGISFLGHFGTTLEIGIFMLLIIPAAYMGYTSSKNTKRMINLALILLVACVLVFVVYYIHYTDLMLEQVKQIIHSTGNHTPSPQDGKLHKFVKAAREIIESLGIPITIIFVFSFAYYTAKRRGTIGYFFSTTVILSVLLMIALYIMTPLGLRFLLFLSPVVAIVSGFGLSELLEHKKLKPVFYILIAPVFILAVIHWGTSMLNGPYHFNF
ncbi:MAG: hypothetical protein JW737_05895 [Acidobacteria bacterium]|nr:hypothetical protein [Acidobacteriota bacterium]